MEHVQFGYGHYGLGAQVDGSFVIAHNRDDTLRGAVRFIHFFPKKVPALVGTTVEQFCYGIGNLADLFFAFHGKWGGHSLETGYNASFFFDARIQPPLDDSVEKSNYIRHNFYGIYKYRFLIDKRMHMFSAALSYGFEPTPKVFGNKLLITAWASWSINF